MRVYLPATVPMLAAAVADLPEHRFAGGIGFAVTPGLREWYASGDTEELEYAALSLAAEASVALVAADPEAQRLRVVVAAEIQDPALIVTSSDPDRSTRGQVTVSVPVPLAWVAAVHVDGAEAIEAVKGAVADPQDDFVAGEVADHELLWYATQELTDLVEELTKRD